MDPDRLFLFTVDECRQVFGAPNDYSILRSTALLRQLLLDGNSLVDVVNRERRERILFTISDGWATEYASTVMEDQPSLFCVADGLHPDSTPIIDAKIVKLKRDQFLKYNLVYSNGSFHNVGEIVSHCANVLGGVHIGSPRTPEEHSLSAAQQFQIGGLPLSLRQVVPLLRVVADALDPLYQRIRRERGG
jgi:hypothetical protein